MISLTEFDTVNCNRHLGSEDYTFIPTNEIVKRIVTRGFEVRDVKEMRIRKNKEKRQGLQKHMVRLTSDLNPLKSVGDSRFELVVVNSHDCSSSFQIMAGVYRLVCSNGMVVGDDVLESLKIRHINLELNDLNDYVDKFVSEAAKVDEFMSRALKYEFTKDQRFSLAKTALEARGSSLDISDPTFLLSPRRYEDNRKDAWTTMNVIQENLIRGARIPNHALNRTLGTNTRNARRVSLRQVNNIDADKRINQVIWNKTNELINC